MSLHQGALLSLAHGSNTPLDASVLVIFESELRRAQAYLPGTGGTVITQAVPPERGPTIALIPVGAELCDYSKCE